MLDGLLGRGFSSKCKSLIKATRTRIDVLRRRKEATQRFLKGNLAQLLSNGLDINAFGRVVIQTEEFLSGLNSLACYDFLEHSCEYVLKKLSMMQKQSECPEECREAVGSLMFAAARFSDLPELRDLRDALQERYGSSLEHFVNREFVERLAMKPPSIDKKIQLLEDLTSELSIKWDSRGFQQRMMANPSSPSQNQEKKQEHIHDCGAKYNLRIDNDTAVKSNKPDQLLKVKSELTSDRIKAKNGGENYLMTKHDLCHRSFGAVESTGSRGNPHMGSEQNTVKRYNYDTTPRAKQEKSELSGDDLRAKNGDDNNLMRKDELGHRSFGRGEPTGNGGKPSTGSEHNTYRRDHDDFTPVGGQQDGEFSSYGLEAKNDKDNYFMRKDESNVLLFEQGNSRGNSCKPHIDLVKHTHRRENYGIIPVGRPEEVEFNSNGVRAKHGRDNYLVRKNELAHLSYGRGDSTGSSLKTHFDSDKNTVRKEIDNISPHHRRKLTGDKNEPTRVNGKEDTVQRRDRHRNSSREKGQMVLMNKTHFRGESTILPPRHRRELTDNKNEPTLENGNEGSVQRRERHGKMPEVTGGIFEAQNNKIYGFPKSYDYNFIADDRELPTTQDGKIVSSADYRDRKEPNAAKSPKIIQEEDKYRLYPNSSYALPPPYVKSKDKLVPPPYMKTVEGKKLISDHDGAFVDPIIHKRDEDLSNYGHEKEVPYRDNIPLPKPRSIRRKHSKSLSHRDDLGDYEDSEVVKRSSSSRRRDHHHPKKGLQILFDEEHKQTDEEERKIDKLLIHYSKKPSTYDDEKARRKVKPHAHETPRNEGEASGFPTRSVSLPHENITSEEHVKVYARANSFQPDRPAGHVHPKLPDYDDLAARFAALKGR